MKCRICKMHGGAHVRTCPEWAPPRSKRASEVFTWHSGPFARGGFIRPKIDQGQEFTEPPEPAEPPPVIEGELVGFRQWTIDGDWKLAGIGGGSSFAWRRGTNKARCTHGPAHRAPGPNCHCGFNAYAKPHEEWRGGRFLGMSMAGAVRPAVPGAVLAWGVAYWARKPPGCM